MNYYVEKHSLYDDYPFINDEKLDKDCLIESIQEIENNEDFQDKKKRRLKRTFFICIYALMINGWLGKCENVMDQKDFLEWMENNTFSVHKHSQFSNLLSALRKRSKFPNWDVEIEKAVQYIKFQSAFLTIYWEKRMTKKSSLSNISAPKTE